MVEVALQYNDTYTENVLAFANNINTVDGGTHVTGFRAALTSSLNDWARKAGVLKGSDSQPLRRRRPRGPHGGHQRQADRSPVRGPDEGQARQRRGEGPGPGRGRRQPDAVPRGEPGRRPTDHRQVPDRVARPRGGAQGARPRHPQGRPRWAVPPRQARRLPGARSGAQRAVTSSRATPRAARRSRVAIAASRPSCRSAGKILNVEKARLDKILASENDPAADHRARRRDRGHRRQLRHHEAPIPPDHHHDRRRRGRRPHSDAAPDALLPPHAPGHRGGLPLHRPAAAVPHLDRQGDQVRAEPRRSAIGSSRSSTSRTSRSSGSRASAR